MLSFLSLPFAIGGLIVATGPILIHLLNRRRHRVVHWAAMDFLRTALQRSRRILQLRDLLLLALRTLCILLFGLAMARPFWSYSAATFSPDQPLHAVIIVDNSLSMARSQRARTLLDDAKERARRFIERLPEGSRVSIVPLCGSTRSQSQDAYWTKSDALAGLNAIEIVDARGDALGAAALAQQALQRETDLPSKRVVFVGDQQRLVWPSGMNATEVGGLPDLQVVQVVSPVSGNTWIEDFRVRDGSVTVGAPADFLVTIRHEGAAGADNRSAQAREDVQVTLHVAGEEVASQTVDLHPGQSRELRFRHGLDQQSGDGSPAYVAASVSLTPDSLPEDDRRVLMVPVVAEFPVVFVDQYGAEGEDPERGLVGETAHLRRLLSPLLEADGGDAFPAGSGVTGPARITHVTVAKLTRELLRNTRLVIIAGVDRPTERVGVLLREFVELGGQVFVAAGGEFDPAGWTEDAWLGGRGFLPTPLAGEAIGALPSTAVEGQLQPFRLNPASMSHDYFILEEVGSEELADLYGEPFFFKAVVAQNGPDVNAALKRSAGLGENQNDAERWLTWSTRDTRDTTESSAGAPADATAELPRVLATYDNGVPFLVERDIGAGSVVFLSSGVYSDWNTLTRTNAVVVLDRVLRAMLRRTLAERTLELAPEIRLPVSAADRLARIVLTRPGGQRETLSVEALAEEIYGVTLRGVKRRGHYVFTAYEAATNVTGSPDEGSGLKLWETTFAVNGPSAESDPRATDAARFNELAGGDTVRWVAADEEISLAGSLVFGQGVWQWLMAAVLLLLLVEMAVLVSRGSSSQGAAS